MASYKITWRASARKELRKLPKPTIVRVLQTIERLATVPYPQGYRKIVGTTNYYRIRVGDYRVIYAVEDEIFLIEIQRVRHRKDAYKSL